MIGIEIACIGRLLREPEARIAKSGRPWTKLLLTVDVGAEDGEFITASAFGDAVDKLAGLARGTLVYIEGKGRVNKYERDGELRANLDVAASKAEPIAQIGRRRPRTTRHDAPAEPASNGGYALERMAERGSMPDDPIPF